jgi:outer membrane protein assembly factor BamE (lipoprotein component of BamABCDE complex)
MPLQHSSQPHHQSRFLGNAAWPTAAIALLLLAPGCAVVKATQQPEKRNLNVLNPGAPRNHVIAELGAPIYSEERNGTTTDIFAFRQGYSKGTKAGRAFAHGAADVLTWGLWEVVGTPLESLADGTPVKVQVTYDAQRNVQFVDVMEGPPELQTRDIAAYPPPDQTIIPTAGLPISEESPR